MYGLTAQMHSRNLLLVKSRVESSFILEFVSFLIYFTVMSTTACMYMYVQVHVYIYVVGNQKLDFKFVWPKTDGRLYTRTA